MFRIPKVLLVGINAKYIHSNLAIRSLRANAREYAAAVEICEYTINHRREDILASLHEKRPGQIGFSCYLWNIEYVLALACDLKKIMPDLTVFLGGPEVSYRPERLLEAYPWIDRIMVGEGEKTFFEYLKWLAGDLPEKGLEDIAGLVFRGEGNHICRTAPRPAMDMDELVFPYSGLNGLEHAILYYESIRGCPFSCSYCLSSIEKAVRIKNPQKTKKELAFFLENRVPQVKFVDRTFNCNHAYAYEVWEYIGEHDNGVTNFHFEIGGDLLREEDFLLFDTFRPGLVQFEIGVQSTNPQTIQAIRRIMDLQKLRANIERVRRKRNIHIHLDLIAGLPCEDYESFQRSFNDVYGMKPDQLQLGFLKVLDGSRMEEEKEEYDVRHSSWPPYEVLSTRWLSYGDIRQLKGVEEMVEVYYNSFQFSASMAFLVRFFSSPFDMYREMAEYYREKGLFEKKQSRAERYRILWEFSLETCEISGAEREDFRQMITYDLYSREYVKNPPEFVRGRTEEQKRRIWDFFDRENTGTGYLSGYEGFRTRQLYHMVYIDEFTVDIGEMLRTGQLVHTGPAGLMFDYRKRDPLNHSAKVTQVVIDRRKALPGEHG